MHEYYSSEVTETENDLCRVILAGVTQWLNICADKRLMVLTLQWLIYELSSLKH